MAGAAVRVPVGSLVPPPEMAGGEAEAIAAASAGGVVPALSLRHGIDPAVELRGDLAGSALRLSVRGQHRAGRVYLAAAVAAHGGILDPAAQGGRVGCTVPLTLGLDVLSVFELWLGVRGGVEHAFGSLEGSPDDALELTGVRAGGVLGLAAGFRRFHVMVELAVDHEYWFGQRAEVAIERGGVVLTPAFAVRLRL